MGVVDFPSIVEELSSDFMNPSSISICNLRLSQFLRFEEEGGKSSQKFKDHQIEKKRKDEKRLLVGGGKTVRNNLENVGSNHLRKILPFLLSDLGCDKRSIVDVFTRPPQFSRTRHFPHFNGFSSPFLCDVKFG